jgi:hypothetical protein
MFGSQTGSRQLLAASLLLVACSSSSATSKDAGSDIVIPVFPVAKDAAADLGPLCQKTNSLSYDSGSPKFPLDWQSAQSLSAWCGLYENSPPTSLCLSRTRDGYDEAILLYFEGGEMMLVMELHFLYDPRTGKLVAQLFGVTPSQSVTCEFRTPDGPPNPEVILGACRMGTPLQPVCAPAPDAGP